MPLDLILSFVILILSIIVHEVAHGWAADTLGDPTARYAGRLTLNPIPHIDPMGSVVIPGLLLLSGSPLFFGWAKPVPYNPHNLQGRWSETAVALAGVTTNLALALFFALLVRFGAHTISAGALSIAATIAFINLFLGLFNLIPFPPLDGFTALRSALPWHVGQSLYRFEASLQGAGAFALILFLLVFSYVLAGPFSQIVVWIFAHLTGVAP